MTATSRHFRAATLPTSTAAANDWRQQAACAGTVRPDDWFPDAGYLGKRLSHAALAMAVESVKAVCCACPSRVPCLDYALAHDLREGVWGGLTEDERAALKRKRARNKEATA